MKKFLLFAAMGLGASGVAFAQDFDFYMGEDILLNDGDRVNILDTYNESTGHFDPELKIFSKESGDLIVISSFSSCVCGPALELDEDGFDYQYGIGLPVVKMCSFMTCDELSPGQSKSQTGPLMADMMQWLNIELCFTYGFDDKGIANKDINAEFTVTVQKGDVAKTVTFYVDKEASGVETIAADFNQPVKYFDLQGREVKEPVAGIYVKMQGGKAQKILK